MRKPVIQGSGEPSAPEPHFLTVARVRKAWGLRGDLKLQVLTSDPDHLFQLETVYLGERAAPYQVGRFWWRGKDLLLKLHSCDDRTQAEALQGQLVQIRPEDAAPLGPDEYYHYQLIGLRVLTLEGEELGTLDEILETGANDVYVVRGPRGEVLLPARAEVIQQVDLGAGAIRVHLLPGLI